GLDRDGSAIGRERAIEISLALEVGAQTLFRERAVRIGGGRLVEKSDGFGVFALVRADRRQADERPRVLRAQLQHLHVFAGGGGLSSGARSRRLCAAPPEFPACRTGRSTDSRGCASPQARGGGSYRAGPEWSRRYSCCSGR